MTTITANCIECGVPVADAVGTYVVCDDCYELFYRKRKPPFAYCGDVAKKKKNLFCQVVNRWLGR